MSFFKPEYILCSIVTARGDVCGMAYDNAEESYQEHLQIYHPFARHDENCPVDEVDYYWYPYWDREVEEISGVAVGCEACGTCFLLTTAMPANHL